MKAMNTSSFPNPEEAICTGWLALMQGDRVAVPQLGCRVTFTFLFRARLLRRGHMAKPVFEVQQDSSRACSAPPFFAYQPKAFPALPAQRPPLGSVPGQGNASGSGRQGAWRSASLIIAVSSSSVLPNIRDP